MTIDYQSESSSDSETGTTVLFNGKRRSPRWKNVSELPAACGDEAEFRNSPRSITPRVDTGRLSDMATSKNLCSLHNSFALDLEQQCKEDNERIVSNSLSQVEQLFTDGGFCSMDKAINEITGLMSIRLRVSFMRVL